MRRTLSWGFGVLIVLSLMLMIAGWAGVAISSSFTSEKAEFIGAIMLFLAAVGEFGVYLFSWAAKDT